MRDFNMADPTELPAETPALPPRLGVHPSDLAPRPALAGVRVKLPKNHDPATDRIYVIDGEGYRRLIPDAVTYWNLFCDEEVCSTSETALIAEGPPLSSGAVLITAPGFPVYLVSGGVKRWIADPHGFDRYHFSTERVYTVPRIVIESLPIGPKWT